MSPDEFMGFLDCVSISTPSGRIRKAVDWDFEQRYFPPDKQFADDGAQPLRKADPNSVELFSDPNAEVVERWLDALREDKSSE